MKTTKEISKFRATDTLIAGAFLIDGIEIAIVGDRETSVSAIAIKAGVEPKDIDMRIFKSVRITEVK